MKKRSGMHTRIQKTRDKFGKFATTNRYFPELETINVTDYANHTKRRLRCRDEIEANVALIQEGFDKGKIPHHVNQHMLDRMEKCGTIKYENYAHTQNGSKFVHSYAFECHNRFCVRCNSVRARQAYIEVLDLVSTSLFKTPKLFDAALFCTVTLKSVEIEEMHGIFNQLSKDWGIVKNRIKFLKGYKKAIDNKEIVEQKRGHAGEDLKNPYVISLMNTIGYVHGGEVTYNTKTHQVHPHFHVMLLGNYSDLEKVTASDVAKFYKFYLKLDYDPICHVEAITIRNKENFTENVARMTGYLYKGLRVDVKKIKTEEDKEYYWKFVDTVYDKMGRKLSPIRCGIFHTYHMARQNVNMKNDHEEILDSIGEFDKNGMPEKHYEDIQVKNPSTEQNYTMKEKKKIQVELNKLDDNQLGFVMKNDEREIYRRLSARLFKVREIGRAFAEEKKHQLNMICDGLYEEIIRNQRNRRRRREEYQDMLNNTTLMMKVKYNPFAKVMMITRLTDMTTEKNEVHRFNFMVTKEESEYMKKLSDTIEDGQYYFLKLDDGNIVPVTRDTNLFQYI